MRRTGLLAVTAIAMATMGTPAALADGCLQRFSCKMGGECRLPCVDELLGTKPAWQPPPAAALDTQPTGTLPDKDRAEPSEDGVKPNRPARSKHARHDRGTRKAATPRLVASKNVTSVDQLAGKPVSFGPPGSSAQKAGRQLFAKLGIKVEETPLAIDNALDGVASGDVAAVVVTTPRDAGKVDRLKAPDMHALSIPDAAAAEGK